MDERGTDIDGMMELRSMVHTLRVRNDYRPFFPSAYERFIT
jgi:hypothetical protein